MGKENDDYHELIHKMTKDEQQTHDYAEQSRKRIEELLSKRSENNENIQKTNMQLNNNVSMDEAWNKKIVQREAARKYMKDVLKYALAFGGIKYIIRKFGKAWEEGIQSSIKKK